LNIILNSEFIIILHLLSYHAKCLAIA
jgi:hypothetical protein